MSYINKNFNYLYQSETGSDHSFATYVTGYVLSGENLIIVLVLYLCTIFIKRESDNKDLWLRNGFAVWFASEGISSLLGALVHQLYYNEDDTEITRSVLWRASLSFMGITAVTVWLSVGTILNPTGSVAICFFKARTMLLAFGIFLFLGYVPTIVFFDKFIIGSVMVAFPTLIILIGLPFRTFKFNKARLGCLLAIVAFLIRLLGFAIQAAYVDACSISGYSTSGCPFSPSYNENAVMFTCLIVGNAFLAFSAIQWTLDPCILGEDDYGIF